MQVLFRCQYQHQKLFSEFLVTKPYNLQQLQVNGETYCIQNDNIV